MLIVAELLITNNVFPLEQSAMKLDKIHNSSFYEMHAKYWYYMLVLPTSWKHNRRTWTAMLLQHWHFSCDHEALRTLLSDRPSVRPSICLYVTPFSLCSNHRIIIELSGATTNDISNVHAKGQGKKSEIKVTEVKTQFSRFRTVTPVWIHQWLQNYAQNLK